MRICRIGKKKNFVLGNDRDYFWYMVVILLTTAGFFICYGNLNLTEPLCYEGDPLYAFTQIKTVMDYGWHMKNPLLGGGEYHLYTFSTGNIGDFFLVKLIAIFTDNVFLVYNLHLYFTYILASLATYVVLRKNGCRNLPAVVMSILFAFLPYHQLRIGHSLWLNGYFVCPLFLQQALELMSGKQEHENITRKKLQKTGTLLIGISLFNIYYTFFGCIIIGIAFLTRIFNEKEKGYYIRKTLYIFGCVLLGMVINFGDTIIYLMSGNSDISSSSVASRWPQMAEIFSFKLIQLFLPQYNHRNQFLQNIARGYYNTTNSHFEGMYASCGIVIAIGVVLLLLLFFIQNKSALIKNVTILNLWMILIGTVGGIGCIIAYVFPMIRSYARISIYIACCSAFIIARLISDMKWKQWQLALFCTGILVFGLWDQTENFSEEMQGHYIVRKNMDIQFVEEVNERCKDGDKVFQLPYEAFPNGAFENLKGYLFSEKQIVWSYGNEASTKKAVWAKTVSSFETPRFVSELVNRGYAGIWISKSAWLTYYSEDEFKEKIEQLKQVIGEPIVSGNLDIYYFDLTDISMNTSLKAIYYTKRTEDEDQFFDTDGEILFYNGQEEEFAFYNDNEKDVTVSWNCKIASLGGKKGKLNIALNGQTILEEEIGEEEELRFPFVCVPGENILTISTNIESIGNPIGVRKSSYYVKGLRIEEV